MSEKLTLSRRLVEVVEPAEEESGGKSSPG